MNRHRPLVSLVCLAWGCPLFAQSSEVSIQTPPPPPVAGRVLAPFHLERRIVAPAKLTNSPRLQTLVRNGSLYLSVQDVIALVLENNLDIAVQRYSPVLAREVLRRAQGGGYLRQVTARTRGNGFSQMLKSCPTSAVHTTAITQLFRRVTGILSLRW